MSYEQSETRILAERLMIPAAIRHMLEENKGNAFIVPKDETDHMIMDCFHRYKEYLDKRVYTPPESRNNFFYYGFREMLQIFRPLFGKEYSFFENITDKAIDRILIEIEEERVAAAADAKN